TTPSQSLGWTLPALSPRNQYTPDRVAGELRELLDNPAFTPRALPVLLHQNRRRAVWTSRQCRSSVGTVFDAVCYRNSFSISQLSHLVAEVSNVEGGQKTRIRPPPATAPEFDNAGSCDTRHYRPGVA